MRLATIIAAVLRGSGQPRQGVTDSVTPIATDIEIALERRRAARADRRAAAAVGIAKVRASRVPDPIMLNRK